MTNEDRALQIQAGKNCAENLERLFYDNLPLWRSVLRPYSGLTEYQDLQQQAFLSIAEAAKKYNAERGSFTNFAVMLLKQDIPTYLCSCGNGLSVPGWYGKRKKEYLALINKGIRDEVEIAYKMGISVHEVRLLELVSASVGSLNTMTEEGDEVGDLIPSAEDLEEDVISRVGSDQLRKQVWEEVDAALNSKQVTIIRELFLDNKSVAMISTENNISVQRVCQIKERALEKLRRSEKLEELAMDYEYITVISWRSGYKTWYHSGESCVERYVIKKEHLDRKRRKAFEGIILNTDTEEEEEEKRIKWEQIKQYVDEIKKRQGA